MSTGSSWLEVEQLINNLRAEQRGYQATALSAEELEVTALATEQQAKDAQQIAQKCAREARASYKACAVEIDRLLQEWRLQRGASGPVA